MPQFEFPQRPALRKFVETWYSTVAHKNNFFSSIFFNIWQGEVLNIGLLRLYKTKFVNFEHIWHLF